MLVTHNAEQLVREFSSLQRQLVDALVLSLRIGPNWTVLMDIPRSGSVEVGGEDWDYRKHGDGVEFTGRTSRRVVDAHKYIERWPSAVDGCRLLQYAESLKVSELNHRGVIYPTSDEHRIEAALAALAREEKLRTVEGGRIWIASSP